MKIFRKLRHPRQEGFSLVEILVTIVIASVVGVFIMKVFSANSKLFEGEKTKSRTFTNARLIMGEVTKMARMVAYNPSELPGGVFGLQQCAGTVGSAFSTATAITNSTSLYFTRDYDETGALVYDSNDMVGINWNATTNTLQIATINPATGAIQSWLNKFPNVTQFAVDYLYLNGTWAVGGGVGLPDNSNPAHAFNQVSAISITLTAQSIRPHELTQLYTNEKVASIVNVRNKYY